MNGLIYYYIMLIVGLFLLAEATDARIRIAVVDTGIRKTEKIKPYLCKDEMDLTGYGIYDDNGHGHNVAHIIASYIDKKKYCLYIIKWYHNQQAEILAQSGNRIKHFTDIAIKVTEAIRQSKAKYVNMSLNGGFSYWKEKLEIHRLLDDGVTFAVAAGNEEQDLSKNCNAFPACYGYKHEHFYVVGGTIKGVIDKTLNYNGPVDVYEESYRVYGGGRVHSGTSQATAIFMGKLIQRQIKRPPVTTYRRIK